jgi:hypothetical protein
LDPGTLSGEIEAALKELDRKLCPSLEDLIVLLQRRIALSNSFHIFIDGLDECEPAERRALLDTLMLIGNHTPGLRIFLASRESLSVELGARFPHLERILMASAGACSDICVFVEETVQERLRNADLVIGDPSLLVEIKCELTKHANGM